MKPCNIIATAAITKDANDLMQAQAGASGADVLCIPLVPIGSPPGTEPTHYAGTGPVGDDMAPLLLGAQALADAAQITLAEAQGLLFQADVSSLDDESFEAACERLGLEKQVVTL